MKTRISALVSAISEFLIGIWHHLNSSFDKKNEERHCLMCQMKKYPLAKVTLMIRTGCRKGTEFETPLPITEILVCGRHHPDKDVPGADLSHETQQFLLEQNISAEYVYRYNIPEHLFRLG